MNAMIGLPGGAFSMGSESFYSEERPVRRVAVATLKVLLLIGAVYNRFRLGHPVRKGLIASPHEESREPKRPVEVIKQKQATASDESHDSPPANGAGRRSVFQRAVVFLAVGAAVAGGVIRRRGGRKRGSLAG